MTEVPEQDPAHESERPHPGPDQPPIPVRLVTFNTHHGVGSDERHDLLITHNFVIAWFVRQVFDAPEWRWLGLNQAHCGLTVLRVRSAKPAVLLGHNDLAHLPFELRTGLPDALPI